MKLQTILSKLQDLKSSKQKLSCNGLKLCIDNKVEIFESIDELISATKNISLDNLYSLDVKVSEFMFLSISVNVSYLKEDEIGKPFSSVKIARNVNAFDTDFMYSDDSSVYSFWSNLSTLLSKKIKSLKEDELTALKSLVTKNKEYFNLQ